MQPDNNTQWQYKLDADTDESAGKTTSASPKKEFSWTAAEFLEHARGASWYLLLIIGAVVLAAGTYFLTKDYFAAGIIIVLGVIIAVAAGHKPRQLTYSISAKGLSVGEKTYNYGLFKSFFVEDEGELNSINLLPIKRFMPVMSAYFDPKDEQNIIDIIGEHLPYEERRLDSIDRLSRRLRF